MLQRAASNAYSWWWASHIRTKQSKWLDNHLQDMEHRVKCMLLLLGEEADSLSKRAEMYYKRRPEVITQVEEVYRAYKALADRYDIMSGELHKANHTIATAFPDQVQYAMLEEEDDNIPKAFTPVDPRKIHKSTVDGLMKKKKGEHAGSKGGGAKIVVPQLQSIRRTQGKRLAGYRNLYLSCRLRKNLSKAPTRAASQSTGILRRKSTKCRNRFVTSKISLTKVR